MKHSIHTLAIAALILSFSACNRPAHSAASAAATTGNTQERILKPTLSTQPVKHDTDDPAIWIHPTDPTKSLIIGTDKDTDGKLYAFDLQGKIVRESIPLRRPNNVDVVNDFVFNGKKISIAVATERERNRIRVFSLPDLTPIDGDGILVFEGEEHNFPMGISLFHDKAASAHYAIVGRKDGPSGSYLHQYKLVESQGKVAAEKVRSFGEYSGKKEIEAIAVDQENGFIYYSDEMHGIYKYSVYPDAANTPLAFFGQDDFKRDMEGISIYKKDEKTGYIIISDQQNNSFNIYRREGDAGNPHSHTRIAVITMSTQGSDGNETTSVNLGAKFPKGIFVAMSEDKTFQIYDWRDIQQEIDKQTRQNAQNP
ncbi:MAG: phytase [Weeksellaceae bacterium]|nr:phytase [Weeksellaceae bacterium]